MKKTLPIFIVSYNRLAYMRLLLRWIEEAGYKRIIIVDNASTYQPLVDFLKSCPYQVEYLKENMGHLAVWKCERFNNILRSEYYVVTDCDIVPDKQCPPDAIEHFYKFLLRFPQLTKVGFGLRIDDLPNCFADRDAVIEWEKNFWVKKFPHASLFKAGIDTTFAMYKPGIFPEDRKWWASGRTDFPYIAQHLPWYEDSSAPSEETKYYQSCIKTGSSHWLTNERDLRLENARLQQELQNLKNDMALMTMSWHTSLNFLFRSVGRRVKNFVELWYYTKR